MAVLLFGAFALIGFRMWMRLRETSSAIKALTERVIALEQAQPLTGTRLAREPERTAPGAAIVHAALPTSPVPREPIVRPRTQPVAPPPTPERRPTPSVAPAAVVAAERALSSDREALESRIGSRWLLYVGVVAIVIGVSYFEKLAIDNHWVNETWRVIQGGIVGPGPHRCRAADRQEGLSPLRPDSGRNRRRDSLCLHVRGVQFLSSDQPTRGVHGDVGDHRSLAPGSPTLQRSQGLALVAVSGRFCDAVSASYRHQLRGGTLWIRHDPDCRHDGHRSTPRLADTLHRQLRVHGR